MKQFFTLNAKIMGLCGGLNIPEETSAEIPKIILPIE